MTGIAIDVTIEDAKVNKLFKKIEKRIDNPRPVLKAIGGYMEKKTDERFRQEKDPQGRPWQKLAKATLKKKKHTKILTESHILRDEINYRLKTTSVEIGTPTIYGAIHQLGGKAGKGKKVKIPARPFLGVNQKDEREFAEILNDHLRNL